MTIYISHMTALECWRSGRFDACLRARCSGKRVRHPIGSAELVSDADRASRGRSCDLDTAAFSQSHAVEDADRARKDLRLLGGGLPFGRVSRESPVHVVVPCAQDRVDRIGVRCHVHARPFPPGSFVRLDEGLYASSPELCFVQMASVLPELELLALGFELCGTYALDAEGRTRYGRPALLTAVSALDRYIESARGIPGAAAARRTLKHLVACSASPRETALTLLLCLPRRMGGYALSHPELNYRVNVAGAKRDRIEKGYYLCDLYWSRAKLDVEYESDEYHTGPSRIARDSERRDDLSHLGVSVRTITNRQIMDPIRFDKAARQLAVALGERVRPYDGFAQACRTLRATVL